MTRQTGAVIFRRHSDPNYVTMAYCGEDLVRDLSARFGWGTDIGQGQEVRVPRKNLSEIKSVLTKWNVGFVDQTE